MKQEVAEILSEFADRYADDTFEVRTDYSGRGMYGKTTYALVVEDLSQLCYIVAKAIASLSGDEEHILVDEIIDFVRKMRYDSMGRQMVIY